MTKRKLPFECMILDAEPVRVTNPFSGESCMLEPDAVAVYDCIDYSNMSSDEVAETIAEDLDECFQISASLAEFEEYEQEDEE